MNEMLNHVTKNYSELMDKTVDVVIGLLVKDDKFLVERRNLGDEIDPGIVCLLGGHVRPEETKEDALIRELLEELAIEVIDMEFLCKKFYIASNGEKQNGYYYVVKEYKGVPKCLVAKDIFWENNIEKLDLKVDRDTIQLLREKKIKFNSKV